MRLLVTRPEPDAERTAAALRARGHIVLVAPLLRIEPVEPAEIGPGPFIALLVTSANAAPAIAHHERFAQLRALPVFAVGDRSAEAMGAAGFADVASARGDVRRSRGACRFAAQSGALRSFISPAPIVPRPRRARLRSWLCGRAGRWCIRCSGWRRSCRRRSRHGGGDSRRAPFFPPQRSIRERRPRQRVCRTMPSKAYPFLHVRAGRRAPDPGGAADTREGAERPRRPCWR